ncbi:Sarcosine dehydrogenase, partial [Caligus rogercresseyi]
GEGFYIVTSGGSAGHNWAHMHSAIVDKGFDVQLLDASRDYGILSLQGPLSRDILSSASETGDEFWSNEEFPFSTQREVNFQGIQIRALRISFLHIPNEHCEVIYKLLHRAGKKFGMVNGGFRAIDSLSIEKGYPHWHQEIR